MDIERWLLFALTGESATSTSRIVKLEIGGPDTTDSCTTQCFRRIASHLSTEPLRAMVYVSDIMSLITASFSEPTVTYARLSTAEIISISPRYGPSSGANTEITLSGSGFSTGSTSEGTSNFAACRFGFAQGDVDVFQLEAGSPLLLSTAPKHVAQCPGPRMFRIERLRSIGEWICNCSAFL